MGRKMTSVFALGVALAAAATSANDEPLDIGSRLELFVDDYLIASPKGSGSGCASPGRPAPR
jgi:hypothetical protein